MRLNVLNSGSTANGYILYNDTEALVIECGCPYSSCLKALGFRRENIVGALISHEHLDHSRYAGQYADAAIGVYASRGTLEAIGMDSNPMAVAMTEKECIEIGPFKVLPFGTQHDCREPFGFLISHREMGSLLFATDTYYVKYRFGGLSQIMIECNYDIGIIEANVRGGVIPRCVKDRVLRSHMSLGTTISTLKANDLKDVQNVVLLHLSGNNSDPDAFKKAVEENVGKLVTVARKGVDIPFNREM